jgi:hypothetical protein
MLVKVTAEPVSGVNAWLYLSGVPLLPSSKWMREYSGANPHIRLLSWSFAIR